ncbi:MAG TPA: lysine 2,3-aminomutase [Candidatus Omnitrophota bacterium]|nr:lysine 2,3-aminomutase [Candidatus Omnitrophota bacterium]HPD84464.1 lysine 2,3-aminomutase [Candidatus Omnitrophota bacterium]HRZ03322.1 lysine 2,3-aminomutase [Candidatus Omnitrophota bacterium]
MNSVETIIKEAQGAPAIAPQITQPKINLNPAENRILSLFKDASILDWEDWRWQMRNRIRTKEMLEKIIKLTPEEEDGVDRCKDKLTMSIPPYFASLIDPEDPKCPVRLQCVPQVGELTKSPHEMEDPCGEDKHSPVHGLVHRYPDRVLFLVSEMCAMYCRYCTRSRMVGDSSRTIKSSTYEAAYEYIRSNKKIRDVLISGGDPLMLADNVLEDIIKNIRAIPHVEFLRIGTRVPVTLPQRVTPELVSMLKRYGPIWMSIHFSHPKEITKRTKIACDLLADSGIPMGSQTVLLKGINDRPHIMRRLVHDLLKIRVRPYYIYQCDPIVGSKHFRTSVSAGINIIEKLRGHTSGYAVPTFVIDGPGGGGKVPVGPNYVISNDKGKYVLRNYAGKKYVYYDPEK